MRSEFVVSIRHAHGPLSGVTVEIMGPQDTSRAAKFTVMTDSDGLARIANLAPGDYWLDVQYLGIDAAFDCFRVRERPSRKAKRNVTYSWGELAPATRRIAGKLLDSEPGTSGDAVWNLLHPVDVPIAAAKLTLRSATTEAAYRTTSDVNGAFAFDGIPGGTYVLHIDAGYISPGRDFEASDQLVSLNATAKSGSLLLKRREASGGSCGGTSFELQESNDGFH